MMSERKGSRGVTELSCLLVAHRRWSALARLGCFPSSHSLIGRDEESLGYSELRTLLLRREKHIDSVRMFLGHQLLELHQVYLTVQPQMKLVRVLVPFCQVMAQGDNVAVVFGADSEQGGGFIGGAESAPTSGTVEEAFPSVCLRLIVMSPLSLTVVINVPKRLSKERAHGGSDAWKGRVFTVGGGIWPDPRHFSLKALRAGWGLDRFLLMRAKN
jgi:hypothetical protein